MKIFGAIVAALLVPAGLMAGERSIDISAAWSQATAVTTFPDPQFVGEYDYLGSAAKQARLMAHFRGFFTAPLTVSYQGLHVASGSQSAQGNFHRTNGYYSSYAHLSTSVDAEIIRWHFGIAALFTQATRSHLSDSGVASESSIDTALSQAYPTGGFTLFPKAPIRISLLFLPADAQLLFGWLRLQAELETGAHTFSAALEILNHASFGKGIPNFIQPPGAFVVGYGIRFEAVRFFSRLGFVLNSSQGFTGARVAFADRLSFEIGASYRFSL